MRILILGGGKIGETIAEILIPQRHDITIIEQDPVRAKQLDKALDVSVVPGSASHSAVLFQAAMSAEICFAVTGSDESNLVGSLIAKSMGVRRVAAHVSAGEFLDTSTFDYQKTFGIDRLLSVEALTAAEFARGIRKTGDMGIEYFADGEVELQEVLMFDEPPPALRKPLCELKFPPEVRVGVIRRESETRIATATDTIRAGDRITLIGEPDKIEETKKRFQAQSSKALKILVGGGGETGYHLAKILSSRKHQVTIMEADRIRCDYLSSRLPGCTVTHGDVTNRNDLQAERIQDLDCFIACTGKDEGNVIAAIEAKEYKHDIRTMVLINRPDYALLTEKLGIDMAVVPSNVISKQILGFLNTGAVLFRNSHIFNRAVDVIEFEVLEGAAITKDTLRNLPLPQRCLIGVVIRETAVQVPGAEFRFLPGDRVIALIQPECMSDLVKFFNR